MQMGVKFEPLIGMARQAKLRRMKMECDPEEIDIVIENPGDDLDSSVDAAMAAKEGEVY